MRQTLLFIAAFALMAATIEIVARGTRILPVSYTDYSPLIGRGRRANLDYVFFNEGFGIGRFNEYGYIGEPFPVHGDDTKIAVVGDSYVEGFQVFERDHFSVLAEKRLQYLNGSNVYEVGNFGCNGFDIGDMYVYQRTFVDTFRPDFVIYFLGQDDLVPLQRDILRPKLTSMGDSVAIVHAYPESELNIYLGTKWIIQNSALMNLINTCRNKASAVPIARDLLGKFYPGTSADAASVIIKEDANEPVHELTFRILESMDRRRTVIVNTSEQPLPAAFVKACKVNHLAYYDMSSLMNASRRAGQDPFEWPVTGRRAHWNVHGHELVAKYVAGIVLEREKRNSPEKIRQPILRQIRD